MNPFSFLSDIFKRTVSSLQNSREKRVVELRRSWGKEVSRERNMDLIAMYHLLLAEHRETVDDQEWQDLAMDEVFARVDRTVGMPGRQILYHQMRTYVNDDGILAERARQYATFRVEASLRENIQLLLARISGQRGAWIAPLLLKLLPEKPRHAWLLYLCSALSIVCLVGLFFFRPLFIPALALLTLNIVINETYGRRITHYFPGYSQLDAMLCVCQKLSRIPNVDHLPQLDKMRELEPLVARLRKRLGWLVVDRTQMPELVSAFFGYLNLFFLFDVVVFLHSLTALRQHQAELVELLEAFGSLDAAISVASFLEDVPNSTVPSLVAERRIDAIGMYHPLLTMPVGNPLQLDSTSALITGSNMAGKTTFIRTVGINVILAQTLHICLAEKAILPRAIVRSSIRREDRLSEGRSYYFSELERILEFIRTEGNNRLHLFLIDEIFRGTNTVERIAASTAVLRHLGQKQMVLVTTHDLELQELLGNEYDMYHFQERIVEGRCDFDYIIQAGPARSRNAIRLLELSGYPESITREAMRMADQIAANFDRRPDFGLPALEKDRPVNASSAAARPPEAPGPHPPTGV